MGIREKGFDMKKKIARIEDKCILCMQCVKDCASGVWREIDGLPVPLAPELCNRCSHCLSICPENAIVNDYLESDQVRPVRRELINSEVFREIVLSRRSIRHFQDKPIAPEIISDIIDVSRYAPTASNSQHAGYIVITDPKILSEISSLVFSTASKLHEYAGTRTGKLLFKGLKLNPAMDAVIRKYIEPMSYYIELKESGRDLILHHAPALVLLHGPALSFFGADNCNIAAGTMIHYAHSLGLGTCFIGFVTLVSRFNKKLRQLIRLPKGRTVYASLVLGYPAIRHPNTVSRKAPGVQWIIG